MAAEWLRALVRDLKRYVQLPFEQLLDSAELASRVCIESRFHEINHEIERLINDAARYAVRLGSGRDELTGDIAWRLSRLEKHYLPLRMALDEIADLVSIECGKRQQVMHRSAVKVVAIQLAALFISNSMVRSGQIVYEQ